jgi:hypothetical protein
MKRISKQAKKRKENNLKPLVLIISNKGGVGKSSASISFSDYARRTQKNAALFDMDRAVRSLERVFGWKMEDGKKVANFDPFSGVTPADSEDLDSTFDMFSAIVKGNFGAEAVLVDVPGGAVKRWLKGDKPVVSDPDTFATVAEQAGYRLVFVSMLHPEKSASVTPLEIMRAFGDKADHYAIRNMQNGKVKKGESDFIFFDGKDAAPWAINIPGETESVIEMFERAGGEVFDFPKLEPYGLSLRLGSDELPMCMARMSVYNNFNLTGSVRPFLMKTGALAAKILGFEEDLNADGTLNDSCAPTFRQD